jgi:hypothetical protein
VNQDQQEGEIMNIMSIAMNYLGPSVVSKVASMMGIQGPLANKLISAAMPAILAALSGKAASASGAGSLLSAIKDFSFGSDNDLEGALNGPNAGNVASSGADMLGGLLGNAGLSSLSGALSRFGGVDDAQSQTVLGMLAPVAMQSLGGQVAENNMGAGELADFMKGQRKNIATAMPAGFASELSGTGLLGDMDEFAGGITGAASSAVSGASDAAGDAVAAARSQVEEASSGGGGMMKWIIGAVVLAGLAWYFLSGSKPEMPDTSALTEQSFTVGDVDVGAQFGGIMDDLKGTVGSITDADSATAALPQLEDVNTRLDGITDLAGQLPESAQGAFGGIVGTALSTIKPLIENAIEASGAGSILQPVVDTMFEKLEGLAG